MCNRYSQVLDATESVIPISRRYSESCPKTALSIVGTVSYMAPEMLVLFQSKDSDNNKLVKVPYTCNIDWWCLGVTMFQLATEKLPYVPFDSSDQVRLAMEFAAANIDNFNFLDETCYHQVLGDFRYDFIYDRYKPKTINSGLGFPSQSRTKSGYLASMSAHSPSNDLSMAALDVERQKENDDLVDLLKKLLNIDGKKRWGADDSCDLTWETFKSHHFFDGLDWNLSNPPYIPIMEELGSMREYRTNLNKPKEIPPTNTNTHALLSCFAAKKPPRVVPINYNVSRYRVEPCSFDELMLSSSRAHWLLPYEAKKVSVFGHDESSVKSAISVRSGTNPRNDDSEETVNLRMDGFDYIDPDVIDLEAKAEAEALTNTRI